MNRTLTKLIIVLASLIVTSGARAALTLTFQQDAVGSTSGTTTFTVQGSKLKVERSVTNRLTPVTIYDAARMELTTFDPRKGTYKTQTKADVEQIERAGTQGPPEVRYEKVGTKKTIAGFTCEVYRVFVGPRLRNQACYAPWGPAVVSREEAEHFSDLMAGMQRFLVVRGEKWIRSPGLALENTFFGDDGSSVRLKMVLKSISHRPVPASTFQLPPTAKPEFQGPSSSPR